MKRRVTSPDAVLRPPSGESLADAQRRWKRDREMKAAIARRAAFVVIPGGKGARP